MLEEYAEQLYLPAAHSSEGSTAYLSPAAATMAD
jgi:hypothetical protein